MHLLMLWHNMASALLISAKPLLALFGVAIGVAGLFDGVAGPFDHPRSGELAGMHLLMPSLTLLMHMLTPMAPMGTGPTGSNLLRVSPIKWSSQRLSHLVTVNIFMSSWEQAAIQGSCWTCVLPYQSSRVPRGVRNQRTPTPRGAGVATGRDFDLPRHSHYSGVIPMVFEHSARAVVEFDGRMVGIARVP